MRYRLDRVQREIRAAGCVAALFADPVNVRYATNTSNMVVWLLHNQGRYCLVPAEGKAVLFEYPTKTCLDAARPSEAVGEIRPARAYSYFLAGEHAAERSVEWAREIGDLVRSAGGAPGSPSIGSTRSAPMPSRPRVLSSSMGKPSSRRRA